MSQKWNLQDIRPAGSTQPNTRRRKPTRPAQAKPPKGAPVARPVANTAQTEHIPSIVIEDRNKKDKNRLLMAGAIFVAVVGSAALLSSALGKTELTIYPEFRDRNINAEFTAFPEATDDALTYDVMTIEETSESQVQASGKIEVEEQASGVLTIRKTTPGAERLIKNTRFRTPEGLVFRIQESVVVPGAITDDSGERVPGSIQAEVFADEVGEQYNVPAGTTFDIPGFQEGGFTALYQAITASAADSFTGGFKGPQFQIDDSELSTARQALQIELRDNLLQKVEPNKPAGTVAFPGAVAITYTQLPTVEYGSDLVTIREQAVLQVPLFKADDLGSFLAQEAVATYDGGPVRVEDPKKLAFNYSNATTSNSVIANAESLDFTLAGKPRLIWEYDADKLAADLAGLPKTAVKNAIAAHPGIEGAKAHLTPFWKRSFPEDPSEIEIIEELREETSE